MIASRAGVAIEEDAVPTKTWKKIEQCVADLFNTRRTPLSGGNSFHTRSDTLEPFLHVETKYRQNFSIVALFKKTEEQAQVEKAPDGLPKIPVVALVERGKRDVYFLVKHTDLFTLLLRSCVCRKALVQTALTLLALRRKARGSKETE